MEGTSDSVHRQRDGQRSSGLVVDMPVGVQTTGPGSDSGENFVPQLLSSDKVVDVLGVPVVQILRCRCGGDSRDKVVDMPVIVNDRVFSSCASQTGTMLPAVLLMAAMMGFLTHFASFFALLRLCRS